MSNNAKRFQESLQARLEAIVNKEHIHDMFDAVCPENGNYWAIDEKVHNDILLSLDAGYSHE